MSNAYQGGGSAETARPPQTACQMIEHAAYEAARRDLLAALGNQSRRSFWGRHYRAGFAHAVKIVREYKL